MGIPRTLVIWVRVYPKLGDTQITVTPAEQVNQNRAPTLTQSLDPPLSCIQTPAQGESDCGYKGREGTQLAESEVGAWLNVHFFLLGQQKEVSHQD